MERRKFIVLLCILFGFASSFSQKIVETDYFSANPSLGGEVVIKKSTTEVKGQDVKVSFEVEAPSAGEYGIQFWMFPTKLTDGSYAKYAVEINGEVQKGEIIPTRGDWQSASISNNSKVRFLSGTNIVSIIGKSPDVPSVEHIYVSKNNTIIDDSKYRAYRANVEKENLNNKAQRTTTVAGDTIATDNILRAASTGENPLYNYTYALDVSFKYTFYKTVSFNKGQQVFVSTSGIDNFTHILEVFSATAPENYSWSAISNSNCLASLNLKIPATGLYYVRVRSYLNARSGFCNLNINGENYYERVPLYSTGFRCTQDTSNEYNTFTCYREGDPRLWIEEGTGIPGKISAFNDDYGSHGGDFNWSLNSRIKKKYSRPVHAALLSAYSSYSPTGKCDLYIKCLNSTVMPYFPNLKADDAIQSSPASTTYNCISWSGGITSHWEWPPSPASQYYSSNPLTAFDNFYASRDYTRTGATKSNAIVALWAIVSSSGSREYTHGSVTKGDGNAHGYDWESKPGSLMRTFHPCDALKGNSYGQIVEYYKPISTKSIQKTLAEEIADGTATIEYVNFNTEEISLINDRILSIPVKTISDFNNLYENWVQVIDQTPFSNPSQIANCVEYQRIFEFSNSHPECLYILYDRLSEGELAAIILIENLMLNTQERLALMSEVKAEIPVATRSGIKVIRPIQSNYVAFVKRLLDNEIAVPIKRNVKTSSISDISYSNSNDFTIKTTSDEITIDFILDNDEVVSLNVIDLSGNIICNTLSGERLNAGCHSYTLPIKSQGIYLTQLIINGKVNVKKVIIK